MATQEEPEPEEMEKVKVENHHITRLLEGHTLLITQNVNITSLRRYLIQYHCIGLMDEERLTRGGQHDNKLELMKVISARGVKAFEGFLAALEHSVQEDPGERGHEELAIELRKAYINQKSKLSRDVSRTKSIPNVSPHSSLPITSVDSHTQLLVTASLPGNDQTLDKDLVRQPSPYNRGSQDGEGSTPPLTFCPPSAEEGDGDHEAVGILAQDTPEELETPVPKSKPKFSVSRSVGWLGSLGVIAISPLLLIVGITLISISIEGFAGKRECERIGIKHSLNVFNFFFGLLCLSVPGLLIMFMLYFHFENSKGKCKKIERLLVWLTIIFFLICFILTIGELLYSLLYVVQEVYTVFPEWRRNENGTLCDGAIYISSLSIVTVSYSGVFLILVGLGFYLAKRYFKWVTDEKDPGAIRNFLSRKKNV